VVGGLRTKKKGDSAATMSTIETRGGGDGGPASLWEEKYRTGVGGFLSSNYTVKTAQMGSGLMGESLGQNAGAEAIEGSVTWERSTGKKKGFNKDG